MLDNKRLIQLFVSAVVAILFVQFYLKAREENIELGFGMTNVLVAARDIPPRHTITDDLVTTERIASRFVEPGAYREKIPNEARKRVIGKISIPAIPEGAQILQTNLGDPSAREFGIAPVLPPGKRGYPLRLGNLEVAKLILPGDHIDILATFTVRTKGSDATYKQTSTILQDIRVVAVDKDIVEVGHDVTGKKETTEGRVLTLAVDPFEAEQLAHAQIESNGEISVVVRAHGDEDIRQVPAVNAQNLLDHPAASMPPAAPGH